MPNYFGSKNVSFSGVLSKSKQAGATKVYHKRDQSPNAMVFCGRGRSRRAIFVIFQKKIAVLALFRLQFASFLEPFEKLN